MPIATERRALTCVSTALGNQAAKGTPSAGSRAPNRLPLQQKETLPPRSSSSRRTSSTNTVHQVKGPRESPHNETACAEPKETRWDHYSRRPLINRRDQAPPASIHKSPTLEEEDLSSSETESDSDEAVSSRRGPIFRRFGKFSTHRPGLRDDEEDDDESPAFLPLSRDSEGGPHVTSAQDLNATLRLETDETVDPMRRAVDQSPVQRRSNTTESSTSSVSSGNPVTLPPGDRRRRANQIGGPLSPRRAELARLSPRRSTASGRETSDGTPSMGSSFSDLDVGARRGALK
ncbi:hypothetical protein EYZ11_011202 [Aspergillus tanneri]|uniref:Uncharacterized protein n=1 Tax=Aspergillus tanneri TaxID=1220188 RepID=A0A4S3J3D0_9EURO|nr:hypothetical protein EYZ11_011202 [Aspergillus tanneri]